MCLLSLSLHETVPYQGHLAKATGPFSVLLLNLRAAFNLDDNLLVLETLVYASVTSCLSGFLLTSPAIPHFPLLLLSLVQARGSVLEHLSSLAGCPHPVHPMSMTCK